MGAECSTLISCASTLTFCTKRGRDFWSIRRLDPGCAKGGLLSDCFVKRFEVKSCPLKSCPLFEHHWVELVAEDEDGGEHWFLAELAGFLELTCCLSQQEATQMGSGFGVDCDGITVKSSFRVHDTKMSDVYDYMENHTMPYSALHNNCQHFARNFQKTFQALL